MKLSNPIAIKSAALAISAVLRAWMGLLDVRIGHDSDDVNLVLPGRRKIFLCWHENLLLPVWAFTRFRVASLVSRHRDGELIAQVLRMMRGSAVRGSTSHGRDKGGAAAVRELLRCGNANHLAITTDGPRGPRRVVQAGAIYLASRSPMPLVPVGFGFDKTWRAGSWDRMALPRPLHRAICLFGRAIDVPDGLDRDGIEQYRTRVQEAMDEMQARAERAAAGRPDECDRRLLSAHTALRWPRRLTGD